MKHLRLAAALLCAASSWLATTPAFAYCRTNSCDKARGEVCSTDSEGCLEGGVPLAWTSSCVTFTVQKEGSIRNHIAPDEFEQVIQNAFDTWMNADCGDGTHPSIGVHSLGLVTCGKVEYNKDQGNANIYVFRDEDWTATGPGNALALTTVWYDWKTGEIYDADVEVNGTDGRITNGTPEDGDDLPSIITHESGHFLGLAHAPFNVGATMYTFYRRGVDNLRNLSADDMAGICSIYPPDRVAASNSCDPRHGFSSTCRQDKSGCSVTPGVGSESGLAASAALSVIGAVMLRRRRRSA